LKASLYWILDCSFTFCVGWGNHHHCGAAKEALLGDIVHLFMKFN
jgi:hypothetical protein